MTFVERVLDLIQKKGISKNKLLTDLALGKNSIVNWKEYENIPNGETIAKLARHFNVSSDYLLCLTDDPAPPGSSPRTVGITDDEVKLIKKYRTLTDEGRGNVDNTLNYEYNKVAEAKTPAKFA